MKIVFLDTGTLGENVSFKDIETRGEFKGYTDTSDSELQDRISEANIVISNKVKLMGKDLAEAPELKLVISAATGMNHIDAEFCKERGIRVMNVSDYSTNSVAQHTFSMLFHLLHSNAYFDNYTSKNKWKESNHFTHLGREFFELKNKTWGIIGLGTIGSRVADIATIFGCNVTYYSSSNKDRSDKYRRVDLEELLSESKIISIHSPLNSKTKNLINKKNLSLIKDGSFLLNLGRGGIISEKDLANELLARKIFVGLDVLEEEPMESDSPLSEFTALENLFVTPHIAWSSVEARKLLVSKIADNIDQFINQD